MKISRFSQLASALACAGTLPVSALDAETPKPQPTTGTFTVTETLDFEMLKRNHNFGYSDEEIRKYFAYPQVFSYDNTGLAKERVRPAPAPGVHPRVFFSVEDLPDLRRRLITTKPGKMRMESIRAMLTRDLTSPTAHFSAAYLAAIRGDESEDLLKAEISCAIIYECFRCLVDNDEAGGKKAAAALTTLAKMDTARLLAHFTKADAKWTAASAETKAKSAIQPPLRDYQDMKDLTQHGLLGLGYDFVFPWMTEAQRAIVRQTISVASTNMTMLDAEGLPAFPANTSNWIPMHMRLLLLVCAIEGEKGYDSATYHRCVEGYKRYLSAGLFPAGDMYESMGKNFICSENLIPVVNRGNNLLGLKQVRAQAASYYLHAMDPWGGHFTFYDSLGGRGNTTPMFDLTVMKYLFPKDPRIDFVYRNTVGENYETYGGDVHFGHPFHLADGLVQAIFATEYEPQTWEKAQAEATAGQPLTFFSESTGNLITRNAWTKDALQFHFLTRSVSGGHQYADRTSFSLYALGRYWAIYKPLRQIEAHYQPKNRSLILIDDKGPGMAMARCAALQDNANATFIAADAKTAYEWNTGGNNRFPKGGQRVPFVANDFRLTKSSLPWMDMPWSDLPNWQTSLKGAELWLPLNTVQRAFRTGGLVRGKHSYVLIVDDFQKDAEPHNYNWGMILEDDVIQMPPAQGASPDDVVLGEQTKTGPGTRSLLVRFLNANGRDPNVPPAVETYELPNPPQRNITMHRLAVNCKTVAPDFKTLLFPFQQGESQPTTKWNAERTKLSVEWSDQKDTIVFNRGADGRTRIGITRAGQEILKGQ